MVASAHNFFNEAWANSKVHIQATDQVNLIGFASGMGAPTSDTARGPEVIKQLGVAKRLQECGVNAKWKYFLQTPLQNLDRQLRHNYLALQFRILAQEVARSIRHQQRFAVIGGDHSCAIGTWSGAAYQIKNLGSLGLIWIDAHMDSHTFVTSHTGALHGMPLACLLGFGEQRYTNILSANPKIAPQNVCLIGVRSYETEEAQLLKNLGIRVIFMQEVKNRGLKNVMQEAIKIVTSDTAGFGISIDLDSIDPLAAPGVSTPELDGISKEDLLDALKVIPKMENLMGVEIAELNPKFDLQQITANLAIDLLTTCLVKD